MGMNSRMGGLENPGCLSGYFLYFEGRCCDGDLVAKKFNNLLITG
jgi:hypothetical protein